MATMSTSPSIIQRSQATLLGPSWACLRLLGTMLATSALVLAASADSAAADPLHEQIDEIIEQNLTASAADVAEDAVLVRRLYLDLTGAIPPAAELSAYLDDTAPDKWPRLVDALLTDERFVLHMANQLDVMFMERRASKHVKQPEWDAFLQTAVRENRPFHQLAAEVLGADGRDKKQRAAAKFYLDREAEPNLLTRDIGRVFFGVDLQCAQCHDHPLIGDYYQLDYYGLYSFVSRLSLFADKKQKISYLAEKPIGEVKYKSVFTEAEGRTNPRLPFGSEIGDEPRFAPGEEYRVKPGKEAAGIPKYSRREQLSAEVAKGENEAFRRNVANRLWAMMMGRGLVHPVDLHHSDNPPSHPELLQLLTDEVARLQFDVRKFLRAIALTKAYRRDYVLPGGWASRAKQEELARKQQEWERQRDALDEAIEKTGVAYGNAKVAFEAAQQAREVAEEAVAAAAADVGKKKAEYDKAAAPLVKLNGEVAAARKTVDLLQAALDAVKRSGVPAEEASNATQVIVEKTKGFTAAQQKRTEQQEKLAAAAAPAKKAHEQAQQMLEETLAKQPPLAAAAAEADRKFQALDLELLQQTQASSVWQLKLDESTALLDASQKFLLDQQAAEALDRVRQELDKVNAEREPVAKRQETLTRAAASLISQRQAADGELSRAREQMERAARVDELLTAAVAAMAKWDGVTSEPETVQAEMKKVQTLLTQRHNEAQVAAAKAESAMELAQSKLDEALKQIDSLDDELEKVSTALKPLTNEWQPLLKAYKEAEREAAKVRAPVNEAVASLEAKWTERFALTGLKGLTAEQLCWSILEATGQLDIQRAAAEAALEKKTPLSEADRKDPAKVAARRAEAEGQARVKLAGNVAAFVSLFAAAAGQPQDDFFATADQALFFRNGSQIRGWIGAGGNSTYQRLIKIKDPDELVKQAYLAILSRPPGADELKAVATYLPTDTAERNTAVQEVMWALITSIEFRFRH